MTDETPMATSKYGGVPISALAEQTGSNIETIRYYERIGVMPEPDRTSGGHRFYTPDQIKRLRFIRRTRELGFTLDEIRNLLRLVDEHSYTCDDIRDIVSAHLAKMREKIKDLRRLEKSLREMVATCDRGAVPECPILEVLSVEQPTRANR
jgi:MerR family mercuric resistance operon transcriptional regulator